MATKMPQKGILLNVIKLKDMFKKYWHTYLVLKKCNDKKFDENGDTNNDAGDVASNDRGFGDCWDDEGDVGSNDESCDSKDQR